MTVGSVLQQEWDSFLRPFIPPHDADAIEWTRPEQIVAVLNRLPDAHRAFLPRGGRLEIARVCMSSEPECIQLEGRNGDMYVCQPRSLRCNVFPGAPYLSYLDFQFERLRPQDEATVRSDWKEEWRGKVVTPDGTEKYGDYTRVLRGWMLICCKASYHEDLDGQYDELTRNQFRQSIGYGVKGLEF
jgi:hypothetical protein